MINRDFTLVWSKALSYMKLKPGKAIGLLESNPKYCLIQSVSPELKKINGENMGQFLGSRSYCISNPESNPSVTYYLESHSQYSIISNLVTDLYMEDQALLLCTTNGLNKIWLDDNGAIRKISLYQANENISRSMSSNYIACIDQQNDSVY